MTAIVKQIIVKIILERLSHEKTVVLVEPIRKKNEEVISKRFINNLSSKFGNTSKPFPSNFTRVVINKYTKLKYQPSAM